MLGQLKSLVTLLAVVVLTDAATLRAQQVTQWPAHVESPAGLLTVYQPQPNKFDGMMLNARAAVSLTPTGQTEPQFGAMWFDARVATDRDTHTVTIQNIQVKQVKLPDSAPDQEKQFGDVIQARIPSMDIVLSLDQLEATLSVAQKAKEESLQLQNNPPKIIFTQVPTTLVVLDGPPKLQDSGSPGVMTVVNTPFIMLFELNSKTYYFKAGIYWMYSQDVTGSWNVASEIPKGVADAGAKLSDQAAAQPAPPAGQAPASMPANIVVSEVPAELISSTGQPTYVPLPPGDLLYMSNTQSNVFMEVATQHFYVLLSGRWFTAPALNGPWSFVAADKLPAAFAKIPPDSAKGNVLVSVAGTQQAQDARYDAYIPQTTALQRNAPVDLTVTYDGPPQFVPIEGTTMQYARNANDPVVQVGNQFYCCSQGVWYQSAAPTGPWAVCTAVPPVIYTMPPSCPIYNCRYCYVYDSTPDTVYCGYLPGYTGSYVYGPTVVYGTGYDYPYWYGSNFYAPPYTYGFGADYDYYTGSWGFGLGLYYNNGWFADRHDRHRWWGPQGYIGYHDLAEIHARGGFGNIRADEHNGGLGTTIDRINLYNRAANIKRNARPVVSRSAEISAGHEGGGSVRGGAVRPAEPLRTYAPAENNVYAGHDGTVYRRTNTGWETHDAKGWTPMKTVPEADSHAAEPARIEQPRVEQPRIEQQPIRENPVQGNPVRESPGREAPEHVEQPRGGGLENEASARMRGSEPSHASGGGGGGGERGGGGGGRR
jgi:hypothetical protein